MKGDRFYPFYVAEGWHRIDHRRDSRKLSIADTRLDRETRDFSHLIGQDVFISPGHDGSPGRVYRCVGVEHFCTMPTHRKGVLIGIVTRIEQER